MQPGGGHAPADRETDSPPDHECNIRRFRPDIKGGFEKC